MTFTPTRTFWVLAVAALSIWLIHLLSPILTPFLLAAMLAYICDPMADWLERRRVPRSLAAALVLLFVVLLFVAFLLIVAPMVARESAVFVNRLPQYLAWVQESAAPWVRDNLGVEWNFDTDSLRERLIAYFSSGEGVVSKVFKPIQIGGLVLLNFLVNLVLVPVVFFYVLRDWDRIVTQVAEYLPRRSLSTVSGIARDIDRVLGQFLRGQLSVMLIMTVYYTFFMWVVGLDYALPIGLVTGLLVFVPYLGSTVGLILATLAGAMQFGTLGGLVPVWAVFVVGQMIEGYVVTPYLVGDRIGLHPVTVIFALIAFGQLFGFFGVLLALPASAALSVGMRHFFERYRRSAFYRT